MDRDSTATPPKTTFLADYRPPSHVCEAIDLRIEITGDGSLVTARQQLRPNPAFGAGMRPLVLDGQEQELLSIALDGAALPGNAYQLTTEGLAITAPPDRPFTLEITSRIHPEKNTALEGLYASRGLYVTQCEAEGFRRITYFQDRPDVLARYTTTIVADRERCPVLLSNGNLVESGKLDRRRHFATWHDPYPKPAYLFAMVAGKLVAVEDSIITRSGRKVALRIYVEAGDEDKCAHAMDSLKRAMRWDEEIYGLEYDLDVFMIVAVSHFNMGAMENKGLNVFNSKYVLARPESATDADYRHIAAIVAHEYFHNWTGNRITCRDWFQLSLKEGLTVFRDQQFSADIGSPEVKRIHDVRVLRASQFPEDAGPMAHPVRPESYIEINNFYTVTVYEKGAEVVRMLHRLLGPEGYRRGMELYVQRHDGQAVTCDDFVQAMEDETGADLGQFRLWYGQAGTPRLACSWVHDAAARTWTLTVRQSCPPTPGQPTKRPMHIPLALGLLDREGGELPLTLEGENGPGPTTRVLDVQASEQRFVFTGVESPPVPSLLRGFSAPVKLEAELDETALVFLTSHDRDGFNRWDAAQRLATQVVLSLRETSPDRRRDLVPEGFLAACRRTLLDESLDPEFRAEVLSLPGVAELGEAMTEIDVEGLHGARTAVCERVGAELWDDLVALYRRLDSEESAASGVDMRDAAIARRRLKNRCLAYLTATGRGEAVELARAQFERGGAMTDVMGTLTAVNDLDVPAREHMLAAFEARWRHDAVVLDKWFTLQATSTLPETLDRVRRLMGHPAFDAKSPNKLRGLIGGFAGGNPVRFHAPGGAGYRFLAEQVLAIDRRNPMVAARLVQPLSRWRRYDRGRQGLMRAALEEIRAAPTLSRDVFEVVTKSLAGEARRSGD